MVRRRHAESEMPIDMALPLFLSKEDFLYRSAPRPCKPRLSSGRAAAAAAPADLKCHADQSDHGEAGPRLGKVRKQVTFADHRGLALTRIKVFSQFSDVIAVPLSVRQAASSALTPPTKEDQLEPDFTQPSSDYLRFRQSLERNRVCLERCVLQGRALAGTVKVKNLSFEKSVKLRVTFDTWESQTEVDCVYVDDSYPGSDCDTFSFQLTLPDQLQPHRRVEFAVRYLAGGREYWDSNQGRNYVLLRSSVRRRHQDAAGRHAFQLGVHFDRFGSPTCCHGIFPDWPSYAGYEHLGPYY